MKQNHTKFLKEQSFILKIDLSNNEIPKAGHYNKKEKKKVTNLLCIFFSEKYKIITIIYCQLSFICV